MQKITEPKYPKLTDCEEMVMIVLWETEETMKENARSITLTYIGDYIEAVFGKRWKTQTISTFVGRLAQKGYIKLNKELRNFSCYIVISLSNYKKQKDIELLELLHGGRLDDLVQSVCKERGISAAEKNRIISLIS